MCNQQIIHENGSGPSQEGGGVICMRIVYPMEISLRELRLHLNSTRKVRAEIWDQDTKLWTVVRETDKSKAGP